jgi:hypothetical protein
LLVSRSVRDVVPVPMAAGQGPRRRLALVLSGRRTIKVHARTVYRCVFGVMPVLPRRCRDRALSATTRRGGLPVFWRICARHQRGFVPVKDAQRRRSRLKILDGGWGHAGRLARQKTTAARPVGVVMSMWYRIWST